MAPKISVIVPVYNVEIYIEKMLQSVKDQTFTDFEVIVVNDGTKDNSQAIIDRFCAEDERFIPVIKENGGIASARNAGLDRATGDYVAFFDSDDFVPENSLQDMYRAARHMNADLVIGKAGWLDMGELKISSDVRKLAATPLIDKFDKRLNRSIAIWNKLYRRRVIEENHLRFHNLRHTEDGAFTYEFVHKCGTITGCNSIVYHYYRRPFWEANSLSQTRKLSVVKDFIEACRIMHDAAEESYERDLEALKNKPGVQEMEIKEFEFRYLGYRSEMFVRFVEVSLISDFYRNLWLLEDGVVELIAEKIKEYKQFILSTDWEERVIDRCRDLALNKKILLTREDIAAEPLVSFVIPNEIPKDKIEKIVEGIYNQLFPSFEVIADAGYEEVIEDRWKNMENFHFAKHNDNSSKFMKQTLPEIRGRYVMYVNEPVYLAPRTIYRMYKTICQDNPEGRYSFISQPLRRIRDDWEFEDLLTNETAFINEFVNQKLRSPYNELDNVWCNKLFYVPNLRGKRILFSGDITKDIQRLYNNSNYIKWTEYKVITSMTDQDILSRVSHLAPKLFYKRKLKQEEKILEFIENRNVMVETRSQRFKKWRLKQMRMGYRFLTRKIIFPLAYKHYARKPVDPKKVIFIEPRLDKLTNSTAQIYDYFKASGEYTIHEHFLRENFARYRDQYKRGMAFIKDFATAKYGVIAEANNVLGCISKRKETVVVNTWHGCGAFKRFGYSTADKIFGGDIKEKNRYPLYHNLDIVTVSSPEIIWAYEEAMHLEGQNVVKPLGISRTDVFFDEDFVKAAKERVLEAFPNARGKKIIFYAPTFRGRIASAAGPDLLDIERMMDELGDEYVLITKHHPLVKKPPEIPADCLDKFAVDMTKDSSIDDLLCAADICISDYSSLVYEYSLFERPMIFFAYDLDDYFDWRGFYYNYEELAPGPIVEGTEEIIDYIKNIDTMFDKQKVHDFKERFMCSCDGHATERIIEAMRNM